MSPLRALLLAAATIGASAFAPYAGPDLERFDFEYQGLRVAGSKPRETLAVATTAVAVARTPGHAQPALPPNP